MHYQRWYKHGDPNAPVREHKDRGGLTTTPEGMRAYKLRWRQENLESQRAYDREHKRRRYAESAEVRAANKARHAAWSEANADYLRQYYSKRRADNLEIMRGRDRERAKTPQRQPWNREWRAANREKLRIRERERARTPERQAYTRRWREENPDRLRELDHRWRNSPKGRAARKLYRVRRKNAPGPKPTTDQLAARWDYFGGKCWMCAEPADQYDHVKPINKGGSRCASNLRPACGPCNVRKSDQWPFATSKER